MANVPEEEDLNAALAGLQDAESVEEYRDALRRLLAYVSRRCADICHTVAAECLRRDEQQGAVAAITCQELILRAAESLRTLGQEGMT